MSALATFFLVMALYPHVQMKAQAEIDSILGRGQLPGFDDRSRLPYVEAVYREVMRWHPAIPMGVFFNFFE
jgi:cytochrome P450